MSLVTSSPVGTCQSPISSSCGVRQTVESMLRVLIGTIVAVSFSQSPPKELGIPTMHPLLYIPFVLLPVLWLWNIRKNARMKGLTLPPGPKRWPIVGNLFNLPSGKTWLVYDELFKQYGLLVAYLFEQNSCIFRRYHILRALGSTHRSSWFH